MRSFMIAAALSVVALGFSGCAMTGGGCTSCDTTITDCGCGDMSGGDCGCGEAVPMGDVDACSCGGVGLTKFTQQATRSDFTLVTTFFFG